ncbi:outer dynein arm-docking complex subunit 1-like isoform X2 [Littorina saxatilis]|uniref:ODAD1 central coiled coil region domain-containing protein n=1 Tax=Littorina saxatilis TaxID=31220 RepID=A0AAN9G1Y9_9CAEN
MPGFRTLGLLIMMKNQAERKREEEERERLRELEKRQMARKIKTMKLAQKSVSRRRKQEELQDRARFNTLNAENINNTCDAHVASSTYFQRQDAINHATIIDSIERLDACLDESRKVQGAVEMVNLKIRETEVEMIEQRLKLKALTRAMDNVHVIGTDKVQKRVEVVEQKYGMQLAENRQLMDMIEHLESERNKSRKLFEELEAQLEQLSKQLSGHIEVAKTTYEQRDINKRNMTKMLDHLDKSTAFFQSDMQLLQFKIDVLKRMERFMTTKNKFRPDEGRERRIKSRSQLSVTEKDSIMYGNLMGKIRMDLAEEDLHIIIKTFIELEEENYMLFKNISETRDQCHTMQVEIDDARQQIKNMRKDNRRKEQENMARKVELVEKIQMCKKEADKREQFIKNADHVIKTYIRGILAILDKLGYTQQDIERLAGVFKCVEERNVRVFLAEIERFVNQLHDLKTAGEYIAWDTKRRMSMTTYTIEPMAPRLTLVQRVLVVPPIHEEGDDVEDPTLPPEASVRPLSCDEMMYHIEEDLESQVGDTEGSDNLPSPNMKDAVSEATGDSPRSPTMGKANFSVDVM